MASVVTVGVTEGSLSRRVCVSLSVRLSRHRDRYVIDIQTFSETNPSVLSDKERSFFKRLDKL